MTERINLPPDAPYVNALLLQALNGIEEVLGTNGLNAVLQTSGLQRYIGNFPPNDLGQGVLVREYAQLNKAVQEFTGRAGKGMLQRVGRASFRWAIKEQQAVMGIAGIALKALPQGLRKKAILLAVRKGLTDTLNYAQIRVDNDGDSLVFIDYTCPICHERTSPDSTCHIYLGSLGEAMAFATGRDFRDFEVVETHCKAKGDPYCRFIIHDRPQ
jgi:hypothetical protein